MGPGRLHALIDGIFAIAATLLVLDLPRPHTSHLTRDLLTAWPSYAAYAISFATAGLVWIEHNGMMSAVRYTTRRFLERTLLMLLFVSLIPWPTALAAEYVREGGSAARTVAALYAGTWLCIGLTITFSWRYLDRHPQLTVDAARPALSSATRRSLLGALSYLLALAVIPINPAASFAVDALIAAYFAVSRSAVPGLVHDAALGGHT